MQTSYRTVQGTRMFQSRHADKREEDEQEGRSMDSEESRSRTRAGTYSRPSLGEEPRPMLTVRGTRMAPSSHADEREEDEQEGRSSMDS